MAKKYKCPYCDNKYDRLNLINHIKAQHSDNLLTTEISAEQMVYDIANGTNGHGRCRVCKGETTWNSRASRYNVLCDNPRCKEYMREQYKKNMIATHGTYNILNDEEQQKKMLANRHISGKYRFTDGGEVTYTGSYERKFLEFMDKFMQIPSEDIMAPGPVIRYKHNGEDHFYITDFLYIPYNLIIEVKDGGDNPNTKLSSSMKASRQKTIEKENVITNQGIYNYIRLTNNQFDQLLEIFLDIKMAILTGNTKKVVEINESTAKTDTVHDNYIAGYKKILGTVDYNTMSYINKFHKNGAERVYTKVYYENNIPTAFIEVYNTRGTRIGDLLIVISPKYASDRNKMLENIIVDLIGCDSTPIPFINAYRYTITNFNKGDEKVLLLFGFTLVDIVNGQSIYTYNLNNPVNNAKIPYYKLLSLYNEMRDYKLEYTFVSRAKPISDFSKNKKGTPVDFTNYQYAVLSKYCNDICNLCFYMNGSIHCATVVKANNGKYYYIEKALKKLDGIYAADDFDGIVYFIYKRLRDLARDYRNEMYVYKYKPTEKMVGMTGVEIVEYLNSNNKKIEVKMKPSKVIKIK